MASVLMVDDDHIMMLAYEHWLKAKHTVRRCFGAEEALLLPTPEAAKFDVFLLDVMMPPKPYTVDEAHGGLVTGVLLARELRRRNDKAHVIFLTNIADLELHRLARQITGARVLLKLECTPSQLMDHIGDALSGANGQAHT